MSGANHAVVKANEKIGEEYCNQHNSCPFLHKNLCIIYRVRPYTCVGYFVTSPVEWCKPESTITPIIRKHLPFETLHFSEFYFNKLEIPVLLFVPIAVHEIIEKGYSYLSTIRGLEGLENEAMKEREVKATIHKLIEQQKKN